MDNGRTRNDKRWLGCLECGEPVQISVTREQIVLKCKCGNQFVKLHPPAGGADGGLPPFLKSRKGVDKTPIFSV